MGDLKAFLCLVHLYVIKIFWQYHHLKEHQPFVIKGQSRFAIIKHKMNQADYVNSHALCGVYVVLPRIVQLIIALAL